MKILHISTSDSGGAGIAAVRLHKQLIKQGIKSKLLTLHKTEEKIPEHYLFSSVDYSVIPIVTKLLLFVKRVLRHFQLYQPIHIRKGKKYLKNQPKGFDAFSFSFSDFRLQKHPLVKEADILHLHWVGEGLLDYSFFKKQKKKIVWTLHDMNPFTGGCHYSDECEGYTFSCTNCPQVKNTIDEEIAGKMLQLKMKGLKKIRDNQLYIITPSEWLNKCSSQSLAFKRFRHRTIRNPIDTEIFKPSDKIEARIKFNLPIDKKIILYVSKHISFTRKGIDYLLGSFNKLENKNEVLLYSLGYKAENLDSNITQLGYIKNEPSIASIYSAADIFVLPSMAENFPNSICEALCCGTPVITFKVGGTPEQVNKSNGIIVKDISEIALKEALEELLSNLKEYDSLKVSSEAIVQYNEQKTTAEYIEVYKQMFTE